MTRRKQLFAALALAGLLVAAALLAGYGRPASASKSVVAMRRDVRAGSILTADDLVQVDLPARLARAAYLEMPAEAVGQAAVYDLQTGQLLERGWLRERPAGITYPDAKSDARLYTLSLLPEQANGFWLAAGNRVDVHLIPRSERLAAGDSLLPDMLAAVRIAALIGADSGDTQTVSLAGARTGTPLVCLAVSAAEARILALAEASCAIKLVPLNEPTLEQSSAVEEGEFMPEHAGGGGDLKITG